MTNPRSSAGHKPNLMHSWLKLCPPRTEHFTAFNLYAAQYNPLRCTQQPPVVTSSKMNQSLRSCSVRATASVAALCWTISKFSINLIRLEIYLFAHALWLCVAAVRLPQLFSSTIKQVIKWVRVELVGCRMDLYTLYMGPFPFAASLTWQLSATHRHYGIRTCL